MKIMLRRNEIDNTMIEMYSHSTVSKSSKKWLMAIFHEDYLSRGFLDIMSDEYDDGIEAELTIVK